MSLDELGQEIIEPNLDLAIDYSEIGLDEFFDNGLLKEIPIVRSLAAIVRTGIAIRERFFIKKFVVFLRELHQGSVDKKEWEEFKKSFDSDEKFRAEVMDNLMIIIDQLDSKPALIRGA